MKINKEKPKLSFRRFELKYVMPANLADSILASISNFVKPDPYTGDKDHYFVNSIYLDSPNFISYQEKLDGLKNRKKFRIRYYQEHCENPNSPIFFEIKRKSDSIIIKDRLLVNQNHLANFSLSTWNKLRYTNPPLFSEIFHSYQTLRLKPRILVHYKRKPYFSKFNKTFRITFDYDIKAAKVDSFQPNKIYSKNVLHNFAVMEVKFNGVIPPWFSYIIKMNNLKRGSFSKYCQSVSKLYNLE